MQAWKETGKIHFLEFSTVNIKTKQKQTKGSEVKDLKWLQLRECKFLLQLRY